MDYDISNSKKLNLPQIGIDAMEIIRDDLKQYQEEYPRQRLPGKVISATSLIPRANALRGRRRSSV